MESTHSGLVAAQLSQVKSSRKGWLVPESGGGWPSLSMSSLMNATLWTDKGLDYLRTGWGIQQGWYLLAFWCVFLNCEKFCVRKAFVDPWYGSGLKLDCQGFGCGLECWCGAPERWDVARCSRSTWTCLVSPRCQSCLGECVPLLLFSESTTNDVFVYFLFQFLDKCHFVGNKVKIIPSMILPGKVVLTLKNVLLGWSVLAGYTSQVSAWTSWEINSTVIFFHWYVSSKKFYDSYNEWNESVSIEKLCWRGLKECDDGKAKKKRKLHLMCVLHKTDLYVTCGGVCARGCHWWRLPCQCEKVDCICVILVPNKCWDVWDTTHTNICMVLTATTEAQQIWEMKGGVESQSPRSDQIVRVIKEEIKK